MLESGHYNLFQLAVRIGLEGHPSETLESRDERVSPSRWGQKNKTATLRPPSLIIKSNIITRFFPFSLSVAASTGHDWGVPQDSSSQTLLS